MLPSVASINGMQVKEYMQALSDEGQIRVEKIGSGNWYWSFLSEERRAREEVIVQLGKEREKLRSGVEMLREKLRVVEMGRGKDEEGGGQGRAELLLAYESGKEEVEVLRRELDGYKDGDPEEVVRKRVEVEGLKLKAARWTDNVYCLEEYLRKVTGGDREVVENVRRTYYGDDYVEGEGLREWS